VSNHAARLEEAGLLSRDGGYAIQAPETVLLLVVRYADSLGDDAAKLAEQAPALVEYNP
jgi:hypothetical protein